MSLHYLARVGGVFKQLQAIFKSVGAADANKLVATGSDGRLDESLMPLGIGAKVTIAPASEALSAGVFVNLHEDAGALKVRLADNSNARAADGFVLAAVATDADAQVYMLDDVNAELTGLTVGAQYWLGTAGGVIDTALDASDAVNAGKVCQYLGKAKSATELITTDAERVIL